MTATGRAMNVKPGEFVNPVYEKGFPDPFVLKIGSTYYAYATNGHGSNVQTLRSSDLVHWHELADAMPQLPLWADYGRTWAPEVLQTGDNRFVLYFTARSAEHQRQCVGAAVSDSPEGPFVSEASEPFVCQFDEGGSIDASPFRDSDGSLYLYWKNDGNCCGMETYIYVQRLSPDGLTLEGEPKRILSADAPWEGPLIEAHEMLKHDGKYYLFFSGNRFKSFDYAVGYATCDGPMGPCEQAPENPILTSECEAAGPGHNSFATDDDGQVWIVYHAWPADSIWEPGSKRQMWIDRLEWKDGKPVVHGPTCTPQPMP